MSHFPAIRIEGGILGPDTLEQLLAGDLPGLKPKDFGLDGRRTLTDEIAAVFADARAQWELFQRRLERLSEDDLATSVTRDAWMIPFLSLLGYELRFNPRAYEVDGLTFAISHRAGEAEDAPPVHIVGARQELGRLAPTGRPRLAPHSLVQEYLNRTEHLWGIVTNGLTLRLLRDSTYVRRQAYVEFDLRQIFDEQRFTDFAILYQLLHRSRLPHTAHDARDCLLEQYYQHTVEQGGRVRDRLRDGVKECIERLANGFLSHPSNQSLRARVSPGYGEADRLSSEEFYRQLLRLVYRLLFLLVSEDRGLISADPIYREHYGVARLRRLLDRRSAYTEHDDIWCSLRVLWKVLSNEQFAACLGAAPLNGELFAPIDLDGYTITNRDFLEAFWHLAYYRESPSAPPRRVNYAALDVEELGSVYESLLDYHPVIEASSEWRVASGGRDRASGQWRVTEAASSEWPVASGLRFELAVGSERKSTGSYYTPPELVAELIRSALEPVIEERLAEAKRMATELQRVASSEWRVVETIIHRWRETDANSILSRLGSLAESHGAGRTSLSAHARLSEGGAFRIDQPDAPSSNVGPSEYRRGLGTTGHERVPPVPEHRLGQSAGAGNIPPARRTDWHPEPGTRPEDSSAARKPEQTDGQPPTQSQAEVKRSIPDISALWNSLPLATRHSLLACALAEHALLSIKVLDPACGSGHFLLAAARRLGKELARIRTGEDEPAPERVREAIRDVVAHCIYGVDKNPLAVELCRVALWLEAHCAGKPLTFLDHRIKCGDSLVGVLDLGVLTAGIPDEAFAPVSTDAKTTAAQLKKRNRNERRDLESGQLRLPFAPTNVIADLGEKSHYIESIADDSPAAVREKKSRYDRLLADPERLRLAEACDLWTAAFYQQFLPSPSGRGAGGEGAITTEVVIDQLARRLHPQALAAAQAIASQQRFFHWPLEFPEVFAATSTPLATRHSPLADSTPLATRHSPLAAPSGFDVVLSNPPWERIKLQEEEFFAGRDATIARAPNAAARKRLIAELPMTNPALWQDYQRALHTAESASRFLRGSGQYPLTGRGDINTYSVFAERVRHLLGVQGRAGIILPTGIATDATNQFFFADLVEEGQLLSLFDFDNREKLFPAVISLMKFSLVTVSGKGNANRQMVFAFFCHRPEDIHNPLKILRLSPRDLATINPNTRTLPVFRTRQDAELTKAIYQRVPVLVNEHTGENPWGVRFLRMLDMSNDSHLFRTRAELEAQGYRLVGNVFVEGDPHSPSAIRYSPLYEAKMIWHYDHRYGTYEGVRDRSSTQLPTPDERQHADPHFVVQPWYWVPAKEVEARLGNWRRGWLLGFRRITNATNERSAIFTLIPRTGAGDVLPVILGPRPLDATVLLAATSSLPFDFLCRQKIGGIHLDFHYAKQLPVLPPSAYTPEDLRFIVPRVLELVYTAWDMKPFADDVWNEADDGLREALRAQWEANRAATSTPLATRHSPLADSTPLATRHSPLADSTPLATRYSPLAPPPPLATPHSPLAPACPFPPFRWDEERRAVLRAELDAYYARLYGLTRKQLRYILDPADLAERELEDILDPWEEVDDPLDPHGYEERCRRSTFPGETFRVLKEKEMRQLGEYRTRRLVLQAWHDGAKNISPLPSTGSPQPSDDTHRITGGTE